MHTIEHNFTENTQTITVKRKLLFVQQHEWDVNDDENYLYANDCYGKTTTDNHILA